MIENLTLSQIYYLLAVNTKGKVSSFNIEKRMCFVAGGLIQLKLSNCISIENKRVHIIGELSDKINYLKPLYDYIKEKENVKIDKLATDYLCGFTDKKTNELIELIGKSLVELGIATEEQTGVLVKSKVYVADSETIKTVVNKIKTELMDNEDISEETTVIYMLLEKSKLLKEYFSQFELKEIKEKIKNVINNENYKTIKEIKEVTDYIEDVAVTLMVAAT